MVKIAIAGKARSGKNKVAEFLVQYLTGKSQIFAFADPIKYQALNIFPWADPNCLFGPSEFREEIIPRTNKSYRSFCKELGGLARSYYDSVWIDLTKLSVQKHLSQGEDYNAIISDMRFPLEYDWIHSDGFYLIKVKRPIGNEESNDLTETSLDFLTDDSFDFIIDNNGSLKDLEEKVRSIALNINT